METVLRRLVKMSNEPISRTEMIRRMVENWLDNADQEAIISYARGKAHPMGPLALALYGADQEAIISYARGKLTEWYKDCNDEEVAELYSNEV
jgi:hypothetical protein|tara:strand:+ start:636 stop:914 length:279 start_codon:yes stop_codon:yes gene_type:complete